MSMSGTGRGRGRGTRKGAHPSGSNSSQNALNKKLNSVASQMAGMVENLRGQLKRLEEEMKADKDGQKEYQDLIDALNRRKADLNKQIDRDQEWCDGFDDKIGGVQEKYDRFLEDMEGLYANAKAKHETGLELLIEHFNYHPLYKRWDDTFSGVPFKPM